MELIEAPSLSKANLTGTSKQKLAGILLQDAFRQLFEGGLFHGDPHPGSLLVLKDGPTLALIDFGLVGRSTRPMQETLVQLILPIALKDSESVAMSLYRLGTLDVQGGVLMSREASRLKSRRTVLVSTRCCPVASAPKARPHP